MRNTVSIEQLKTSKHQSKVILPNEQYCSSRIFAAKFASNFNKLIELRSECVFKCFKVKNLSFVILRNKYQSTFTFHCYDRLWFCDNQIKELHKKIIDEVKTKLEELNMVSYLFERIFII